MRKNQLTRITVLSSLLFGSALAFSTQDVDAAVSSLKSYKAKVTVTASSGQLYADSNLKSKKTIKKGTVYQADGYRIINGKKYYRVYQNSYRGYIDASSTKTLSKTKTSEKKYVAAKDKNIWNDLYFQKKNTTLDKERIYLSDGYYTLGDGKKYYSISQIDSAGKKVWKGYIYSGSLKGLSTTSYNKKVQVTKDNYTLWQNHYFSKKGSHPNTTVQKGQVYTAKSYFTLNGKKYYSLYRLDAAGKEKWYGYVDGGTLLEATATQNKYFDYKNIDNRTGYINTGAKITVCTGPTSNYTSKTVQPGYKKSVTYTEESFNEKGNMVKVFNGTPSSSNFIGWMDRRYIYDNSTTKKIADPNKGSYGVWDQPYGGKKLASMESFKNGNIEVNQCYLNPKGVLQWHIAVNGAEAGWVDANFVSKNQINIPEKISLVKAYTGQSTKWNPIDAINYATTGYGSVLNPTRDVKVNIGSIDTSKPGTYKVTYSTSTASKTVDVVVRAKDESKVKYTGNPQAPAQDYPKIPYLDKMTNLNYTLSQYRGGNSYGTAPQGSDGYGVSSTPNKWTTVKGNSYTFQTQLFVPFRLSDSANKETMSNAETSQPQGLAVIGNKAFVMYKKLDESSTSNAMKNRGFIVSYDLTKVGSLGQLRDLRNLSREDFSKYASICSGITVGPEIVVGHGQTLTTDGKNLYINQTNEREDNQNYDGMNAFNKVNTNTLTVTEYTTSRIIAAAKPTPDDGKKDYVANRQFFNMAAKDENTFYGLYKCGNSNPDTIEKGKANWEIWESKRNSDGSFTSKQVLSMRMPIGIETPIQGITYVDSKNALYIVTDGGFVGIKLPNNTEGTGGAAIIDDVKLNSQKREAEGIAIANGKIYIGSNKGSEILAAPFK